MRAYLPGIGPDKDVKLTVSDGMLHIEAERRQGKPGERASAGSCGRETARYRRGPGASRGDGELGQAGAAGAGAGAAGTWQLVHSLGWGGFGGGLARWTLPVLASIAVIVVHHLGYAEYRDRQLVAISAGCGLLTVGYLVTASVIAPTLGHVLMHTAAILHGAELPPLTRPVTASPASRPETARAPDAGAARNFPPGRHRSLLHGR